MPNFDRAYVYVTQRVTALNAISVLAIYALIVASRWEDHRSLAWIVIAVAVLLPANIWISVKLVERGVRRAEALRFVVTGGGLVALGHAIGWPLPMWLFLPLMALALADFGRRLVWTGLLCTWAGIDACALYDGVGWLIPAAFTLLGVYGRLALDTRLETIREMFEASDAQHRALDGAHASLRAEIAAREHAEGDLRQAQKLEAIGRLSAGIAHEINTPLQFVTNNVEYIADGVTKLLAITERVVAEARTRDHGQVDIEGGTDALTVDLDELRTGVPDAMRDTLEGIQRVSSIVAAMKSFAGTEGADKSTVRLEQSIEETLAITKHETMYIADVVTELGAVPPVTCHPGEIGQVVLSLVVNAAQAIDEGRAGRLEKGRITIRMVRDGDHVEIAVSDTGAGIPEGARHKIFEPFFTTRIARGGTGQGLAIARAIVVERHGGSIRFETVVGRGTTFFVRLPIDGQPHAQPRAA